MRRIATPCLGTVYEGENLEEVALAMHAEAKQWTWEHYRMWLLRASRRAALLSNAELRFCCGEHFVRDMIDNGFMVEIH